ncbi:hypothetical protein ADIWIN_1753 [Winogradskyella psychrotolerans RS-3]|uniref:Uncharacterized protein n=1 Tax=Winogradskyella psychrotolerans RS-3 TaxID=641526 RepID=S7VVC1_9FLAO|nr:hypothetical protein ADIWIN_1753 [Winogradskyella psychrotolerans RS-3]
MSTKTSLVLSFSIVLGFPKIVNYPFPSLSVSRSVTDFDID